MDKRNYEILSGDTLVAKWHSGNLEIVNGALLPLYLKRIPNADMWLETRAIDSHRANSRLLKKALRLAEKDDISTVIHVNGATITDNYWIRPIGSELTYADIRFSDDYFSNLALKGTYNSFNRAASSKRSRTPELTNVGSFEKCWKLHGGKWQMYKKANHEEMFSELFVYELGKELGMNMAVYERGEGCVRGACGAGVGRGMPDQRQHGRAPKHGRKPRPAEHVHPKGAVRKCFQGKNAGKH
jgi:hypothetical protein